MSRSFGDLGSFAHIIWIYLFFQSCKTSGSDSWARFGFNLFFRIICDLEIYEFDLIEEDKFFVIGSDGIFEFLSNI